MSAMSNQNAKQARAAGRVQDLYLWRRAFATELNARGYDIFINASQTPLVSGWHRANREPRPEPLVLLCSLGVLLVDLRERPDAPLQVLGLPPHRLRVHYGEGATRPSARRRGERKGAAAAVWGRQRRPHGFV